jgi:hypothetical protein
MRKAFLDEANAGGIVLACVVYAAKEVKVIRQQHHFVDCHRPVITGFVDRLGVPPKT